MVLLVAGIAHFGTFKVYRLVVELYLRFFMFYISYLITQADRQPVPNTAVRAVLFIRKINKSIRHIEINRQKPSSNRAVTKIFH